MGMTGNGCPNTTGLAPGVALNEPLAGEWTITRSEVTVTLSWTINGGGEKVEDSTTTLLEPLDPSEYPSELASMIDSWNNGLADLNAALNAAMPEKVWVTFPHYGVLNLTNVSEPTRTIEGAIDGGGNYIFIGDVSGAAAGDNQGGGALFQAASIQGIFDRTALTTEGTLARTLLVIAGGVGGGNLSLTAKISVDYTGIRTGDLPAADEMGG
ncbi:MAG: hypothetical protein HZA51_18705 [Planctomycetes bacterium]|nr:hypothetical protein [Planctomycetota bacterium]